MDHRQTSEELHLSVEFCGSRVAADISDVGVRFTQTKVGSMGLHNEVLCLLGALRESRRKLRERVGDSRRIQCVLVYSVMTEDCKFNYCI